MKPKITWYVVVNSNRARILPGLPAPRTPALSEISMHGPNRKLRDVRPYRPVRSFASAGGGRRSAVDPGADPIEEDTRRFLIELATFLERKHEGKAFDQLVFVSPDDVLGLWRSIVSPQLKNCTAEEYRRNLMGLSPEELALAVRKLTSA